MKRFWIALSFLTALPVPKQSTFKLDELGQSAVWFPLIGALIGGVVAVVRVVTGRFLPLSVSAALSVIAWVWVTGGLHLDGLADCFDGMLNASPPQRRLEIMKDSRVGTFGVIGLIFAVLLKGNLLVALPAGLIWVVVPLAASTARWLLLWGAYQPMARPDGMGSAFKQGIRFADVGLAAIIPLGLVALAGVHGLFALVAACIVALGILRLARVRLGGMSGDVLGLMVETVELAVLLVFVFQLP